jgi:hypothetical protein
MCATVVYPPNPPRALACTKGNPDEFFVLHLREKLKESLGKGDPWIALLQINQR